MQFQNGILRSDLLVDLPVVHGFTTIACGNLGFGKNPGDPDVIANRQRLFAELRLADRILVQPKQTHSARVVSVAEFAPGCEADATFGGSGYCLHSILTADCVPLLAYHPSGVVAAIHAGWRGLMADIIPAAIALLPKHPMVAIGPAIGPCCYEVSEDLAGKFEHKYGSDVVDRSSAKPHLDLVRAALIQLRQAGVEDIDAAHLCTSCHPDLFFSYRRDGSSGRQLAFIGLA
jgi:hypothetical protein